jgi:toxin secretion/phage lysis holin
MQYKFCAICGIAGSTVSYLFGGWDAAMQALLLFMAADYLSGLLVAGVFCQSQKTESGGLNSSICFQGLVKKSMMLLFVLVAHRLDAVLGTSYIRDGVSIAFLVNELISIIENAGIMGIPVPKILQNAIDVLKQKEDKS